MTRMQAERQAYEKNSRKNDKTLSYVAELLYGNEWGVQPYRNGKRVAF